MTYISFEIDLVTARCSHRCHQLLDCNRRQLISGSRKTYTHKFFFIDSFNKLGKNKNIKTGLQYNRKYI